MIGTYTREIYSIHLTCGLSEQPQPPPAIPGSNSLAGDTFKKPFSHSLDRMRFASTAQTIWKTFFLFPHVCHLNVTLSIKYAILQLTAGISCLDLKRNVQPALQCYHWESTLRQRVNIPLINFCRFQRVNVVLRPKVAFTRHSFHVLDVLFEES